MMCGILVGANSALAQPIGCPAYPPGTIFVENNNNCKWDIRIYNFPILMPNGMICDASITWCERCCNGVSEFFFKDLSLLPSCINAQAPGFSLQSKFIMDQVRKAMFHPVCNESNTLGGVPVIPPCPDHSQIVYYFHKAQCYSQTTTYYTDGRDPEVHLTACSNIIGCTNYYSVCFDGTNYQYEYVNTSYIAVCPNTNGCFGFCDETQP